MQNLHSQPPVRPASGAVSHSPLRRTLLPAVWIAGLLATTLLSGCAAALLAGGAVGGYAVAKDMEDGKLIDTKEQKKKNWFG